MLNLWLRFREVLWFLLRKWESTEKNRLWSFFMKLVRQKREWGMLCFDYADHWFISVKIRYLCLGLAILNSFDSFLLILKNSNKWWSQLCRLQSCICIKSRSSLTTTRSFSLSFTARPVNSRFEVNTRTTVEKLIFFTLFCLPENDALWIASIVRVCIGTWWELMCRRVSRNLSNVTAHKLCGMWEREMCNGRKEEKEINILSVSWCQTHLHKGASKPKPIARADNVLRKTSAQTQPASADRLVRWWKCEERSFREALREEKNFQIKKKLFFMMKNPQSRTTHKVPSPH